MSTNRHSRNGNGNGYGAGATFTQVDATHWQVNYGAGLASHDIITFQNGAPIHATDYVFV